jgi:hypothetical protein
MLSTYKVNPNKKFDSNQMIDRPLIKQAIGKIMMDVILDLVQKNPIDASILIYKYHGMLIFSLPEINNCSIPLGPPESGARLPVSKEDNLINQFINNIFLNFDTTINKTNINENIDAINTNNINIHIKKNPNIISEYNLKNIIDSNNFKINGIHEILENLILNSKINKCILENFKGDFCSFDTIHNKQKGYLKNVGTGKPLNSRLQLTKEEVDIILLLYKTCIFNQEKINKLSDSIFNIIAGKYEEIYGNINKSNPQYENIIQFLDIWSASNMEKILATANMLPKVQIRKEDLLDKALKVQTPSDKTLLANLQLDKLVPKNLIPKDLEQLVPKNLIPKDLEQLVSKQLDKSIPKDFEQLVSKQLDKTIPKDLDKLVSKQLDKTIPKDLDKLVSKQLDKTIPKDLEQLVSKQLDKSIPNPKETPKVIPSEERKSKGETQSSTSSNDNIYYIGGGITVIIIIIILVVLRLMKKI